MARAEGLCCTFFGLLDEELDFNYLNCLTTEELLALALPRLRLLFTLLLAFLLLPEADSATKGGIFASLEVAVLVTIADF